MTDSHVNRKLRKAAPSEKNKMYHNLCPYCGDRHAGVCPRVAEIEYFPDGGVKRVVFKSDKPAAPTVKQLLEAAA
jgi:hypothetical protein